MTRSRESGTSPRRSDAPGARVTQRLRRSGLTASSQRWIQRQLADPYVRAAREKGYRSRAAFKLIGIDQRFGVIRKKSRLVDLGCAPGSWLQVAIGRGAGTVVGVDLTPVEPLDGASVIRGDAGDPDVHRRILAHLGGAVDVVLSDMAAPVIGDRQTDRVRTEALGEIAVAFALAHLSAGGTLCCKTFQGGAPAAMLVPLRAHFARVRHVKPAASRKTSPETFLVATGFGEKGANRHGGLEARRSAGP